MKRRSKNAGIQKKLVVDEVEVVKEIVENVKITTAAVVEVTETVEVVKIKIVAVEVIETVTEIVIVTVIVIVIVEEIETTVVIETETIDGDPIIADVAGREIVTVGDPEVVIEIQALKKTPVKVHHVLALLILPCLNNNMNSNNKIRLRPTNLNNYFPPYLRPFFKTNIDLNKYYF